jgi:hypothetical protein
MKYPRMWVSLMLALLLGLTAHAQDQGGLAGVQLDYTYEDGGRVVLSFEDGQLSYRWLSGPFEGVEERGLQYQHSAIRPNLYVISWHDTDNFNFVTLIVDLEHNVLQSSAVLYYGTEDEVTSFARANINAVRHIE